MKKHTHKTVRREMLTRLSTDGRLIIPLHVQKLYNLKKGDLLEITLTGIIKNDGKEDAQNGDSNNS